MSIKHLIPELDKIVARYEHKQAALLPVLHWVQEKDGCISPEAEQGVADYLGVSLVHVHSVIAFYHLFTQTRKGKCHFSLCQTTSCALGGAEDLIEYLKTKLNINPGETTPDGKFSLSVVECLGACELAPAMQCNKDYKGFVTKQMLDDLIKNV